MAFFRLRFIFSTKNERKFWEIMKKNNKHRVVITGIGLVTPLGCTTQDSWQNLLAGTSGITRATNDELSSYRYNALGRVSGEGSFLESILDKKLQAKTDRFIHLSLIAGKQALDASNALKSYAPERIGVCMGVGIGGLETVSESGAMLQQRGVRGISPFLVPRTISNMAANWLSMKYNLQGPSFAITSACSSGADAIGHAFRMIRDGYVDAMLAGGAESCLVPTAVIAFGNMRALSAWQGDATGASRPFDKERTGFVIAEGAGVLQLERKDLAEQRGAYLYAELAGYGESSDAYHMTAMHPEARGAVSAMRKALDDAQADISEVAYVNTHGTGTPMNDMVETKALKTVFGAYADPQKDNHLLVGSTKSMTGHMIGAAGGVEVGIAALALKNKIVPPTINLETPDPACDLDYISSGAQAISKPYALSNSFGFGGGNAVVVLRKA